MPSLYKAVQFGVILIAFALVGYTFVAWKRTPRLSQDVRRGIQATLECYPTIDTSQVFTILTSSRDGLGIALLLLNNAAKSHQGLYSYKVALLRALVGASRTSDWWVVKHSHAEATNYRDTMLIYVNTTVGPLLNIPTIQITAHVSIADYQAHFADAPEANGRTWAGIPLQPHAEQIARAYVQRFLKESTAVA